MLVKELDTNKKAYFKELEVLDYSKRTIKNYNIAITKFINYCNNTGITEITNDNVKEVIKNYQGYLKDHTNYTVTTVNRYVTDAVTYLRKQGFNETVKSIKTAKGDKEIKYLTVQEIEDVIATINIMYEDEKAARLETLIRFMFTTGLRVHELEKALVKDINTDKDGAYITIHGKGNKTKLKQPIPNKVYELIKHMLEFRNITDFTIEAPLFINNNGHPLKIRTVQNYFNTIAIATDQRIKAETGAEPKPTLKSRFTPHSLRHSLAIYLLMDKEKPINYVRAVLRHDSILTTQKYLELSNKEVRNGFNDLF